MNIGHDIQMEHAFNTFLNAKSIGDHFRCFHNVTLGQKNGKTPTIGNNVWLLVVVLQYWEIVSSEIM